MIICDRYRFCFIHIPKCAGTSVRFALQRFDDTGGRFSTLEGIDPETTGLDHCHIPLFALKKHYPAEFEKICDYSSYAVIRDPFERFPSSVYQHLTAYGTRSVRMISKTELKNETSRCIDYLSNCSGLHALPREYIHFQRQRSFIYDGDKRIVGNLYPVEKVAQLLRDVSRLTGELIKPADFGFTAPDHMNVSIVYRFRYAGWIIDRLKPAIERPLERLLPRVMKTALQNTVYMSRDRRFKDIYESNYVRQFVESYYASDIELLGAMYSRSRQSSSLL